MASLLTSLPQFLEDNKQKGKRTRQQQSHCIDASAARVKCGRVDRVPFPLLFPSAVPHSSHFRVQPFLPTVCETAS